MTQTYHAGYVIDASVAVKWFVEEDHGDKALALREHYNAEKCGLSVPGWLFFLEVANALARKPGFSEKLVAQSLEDLWKAKFLLSDVKVDLLAKTIAIAYGYKTSIYDSAYVAVAETTGFPLVTADEELLKRMKGHSLVLPVWDLEFPATAGA